MSVIQPALTRSPRDTESSMCLSANCRAERVEGSPVPLCGRHLRQVYEFAQDMVNTKWADQLAASTEATRTITPPTTEIPSWVYFVRVGDLIKIGYSTYPAARFKTLKVDEVLAVMPGTMADERRCHTAFAHLREHGEYFRSAPDLLEFIADIRTS